jgi:hypothetical protein
VPEFVVEALELIDIGHDDGHAAAIAAGALDLLGDAKLEKSAVENAGQAIEVGQLFYPLNVMGVLDGSGANVCDRFKGLLIAVAEGIGYFAVQTEDSEGLPE